MSAVVIRYFRKSNEDELENARFLDGSDVRLAEIKISVLLSQFHASLFKCRNKATHFPSLIVLKLFL